MMERGGGDLTTGWCELVEEWGPLGTGSHGLPLLTLHQMVPKAKLDHEVEGAIHTSEVAVNGRSASPWAAAVPAAAEARSPKVKMLGSQGILRVSGVIPDLGKVFAHQMKGCRKGFERCEQSFTPHPVTIIHARSGGSVAAQGSFRRVADSRQRKRNDYQTNGLREF